ncbi:metal ABC transporter solute-binding protein, Zn/Mn family [Chengkuizengella axinellae]|uniref:Zinc ABC transporter substrate-binding protein n=1 Tax=Chengkuizengella axinellae TaxID=3064388 RepID=A0ABT9J268_9BACL|nr:zinc ABC transporter substrate-binding protein [Chengkuizengella sp. 2205SS18-9]MDP5275711.1 zinc ABC transporter substrate-binding protein [Chengkuizengella sp. 2205SS18-9]
MLKKFNIVFMILFIFSIILVGCVSEQTSETIVEADDKIDIVTTFYPLYDFAEKIGGEYVNVQNLVPTGVEPHDWSPKTRDMIQITEADLFIYNGLGFESWIENFFSTLDGDTSVGLVEASLGTEKLGSELEEGHEDEDDHEEEHGVYDPHIWLSPVQAKILAENIKQGLINIDPTHKDDYEERFIELSNQLDELHLKYKEVLENTSRNDFVVSHQAYGYLANEYELTQHSIMGLSPDAEPTIQDYKNISIFIEENNIQYILFEELVSPKLAESLAKELNIETLVLNPLEGLTEDQAKNGDDYFTIMESNLTSLEKALQ